VTQPSLAAFILTHRRPHRQDTLRSLASHGWTGPVYLIVDDEDPTLAEYQALYSDMVHTFSKSAMRGTFDVADNFGDFRGVVWARNACATIAQTLGVRFFVMLDDDYTSFRPRITSNGQYVTNSRLQSLDAIWSAMCQWMRTTNVTTIAMSQGGDWIGGGGNGAKKNRRPWYRQNGFSVRKAMNSFIVDAEKPIQFLGRSNEDVNAYIVYGATGQLFFTMQNITLIQRQTQQNAGGMTDLYLAQGTYVKTFYTIMMAPSCVRVSAMGDTHQRIHHAITWANAVPVIVPETYRKPRGDHAAPNAT
jgi:hypothetical protein